MLIILLAAAGCGSQPETPRATQGRLDLSEWAPDADGPVVLNGEWEFAWGTAYDPDDPRWAMTAPGEPDYLNLPGLWQGRTADGRPLSPHGLAVYRLRVRMPPDPSPKSLLISGPLAVCRVWVNGRPVGQTGVPGRDKATERPARHVMAPRFVTTAGVMDVVLEVSNHRNMQGGINSSIYLGTAQQIDRMLSTRRMISVFIASSLLVMCVYHLALYFLRRNEKANLYFAVFCLMLATATAFSPSGAFLLTEYIHLPWQWGVNMSLLPYGFTIPLLIIFYHALFPKKYGRIVHTFFTALGLAYVTYILATPPNAYDVVPFAYFLITRAAFLYLFIAFAIDVYNKEPGVLYLIPGYLALAAAEFDDILLDLHFTASADFAPVGVFLFILSYSFFMSARHSRVHASVAELTAKLEHASAHIVQLRTQETAPSSLTRKQPPPDRRQLAVRLLNLAVSCWTTCTQTTKAELAERSGIWNVYIEKDGYCRTQTLDKYLHESTLPKKPRWRQITDTARFVLASCDAEHAMCRELAAALEEFESL